MTVQIPGLDDLKRAIDGLPARVVLQIMNRWTLEQARELARIGRATAPRDKNPAKRRRAGKPQSARLWRAIRASRVTKGLKKFPRETVSRSIAYGAADRFRTAKSPRARHFHLIVKGLTKTPVRYQHTTGRRTGGLTINPFWDNAAKLVLSRAQADVAGGLKRAYDYAIEREIKRIVKRYG